jgi:pyrimidine deaminase RibD-like protein
MSARKTDYLNKKRERDPDFVNAEIALNRAAKRARQRAKEAGIGVIVLKDGQIVEERTDDSDLEPRG